MTTHLDIYKQATSGTDEPWERLGAIAQLRRRLDDEQYLAVRQMRRGGASWATVATYLDCTRQAACERYRGCEDERVQVSRPFGRLVVERMLVKGS